MIKQFKHKRSTHIHYIPTYTLLLPYSFACITYGAFVSMKTKPVLATSSENVSTLTDSSSTILQFRCLILIKYLRGILTPKLTLNNHYFDPTLEKLQEASQAFKQFLINLTLPIDSKYLLFDFCILPILAYACPIWRVYVWFHNGQSSIVKFTLNSFEMRLAIYVIPLFVETLVPLLLNNLEIACEA